MSNGKATPWASTPEDTTEGSAVEHRGSAMQRLTVPATAIEPAPVPERTPEERLADQARSLVTRPGIIGAARWSARPDDVEAFGALSRTMAERMTYFAEIARRIGTAFGFVGLREMHFSGETRRLVLHKHAGGHVLCVVTTTDVETTEASRALRGETR